jgi:hypothetical protein
MQRAESYELLVVGCCVGREGLLSGERSCCGDVF